MQSPCSIRQPKPSLNTNVQRAEADAQGSGPPVSSIPLGGTLRNLWLLSAITWTLFGCERTPEAVSPDHPVLGVWTFTSKDGACLETYRFRSDNVVVITSGDEVAEVRSMLSATPGSEGFYRWSHTVVSDNGGKDCSGKVMKIGDSDTWFIQLNPTRDRLLFCQKPSPAACFGPLQRVS